MPRHPFTILVALACAAATAACGGGDGSALPCVSGTPSLPAATGGAPSLPGVPSSLPTLPGGGTSAPAGGASGAVDCVASQVTSVVSSLPVSLPPVSAPPAAVPSGRFRLSVVGFRAAHETTDHGLDVDGKRDEVRIRAKVQGYDLTGSAGTFTERDSLVLGDVNNQNNRMQAGSASDRGGIRTGDTVDGCVPGAPGCQLPFVLWEGELRAGRDAVAVVPMLWEWDDTRDPDLTEPDWRARLSGLAPTLLGGAANAARSRLNLPRVGLPLPGPLDPNATAVVGELLDTVNRDDFKVRRHVPGIAGRAGDRPIGFLNAADDSDKQDYFPRVVTLTYETALLATRTDLSGTGRGNGSLVLAFREARHWLEGDYEMYLRIDAI